MIPPAATSGQPNGDAPSITPAITGPAADARLLGTVVMLGASPFGWPLVAAAGLKIAYDLALLAIFRKVRPPEEGASACARA